jgi:hypothetical protein
LLKVSPCPCGIDIIATLLLLLLFLATVLELITEIAKINQALFLGCQPFHVIVLA